MFRYVSYTVIYILVLCFYTSRNYVDNTACVFKWHQNRKGVCSGPYRLSNYHSRRGHSCLQLTIWNPLKNEMWMLTICCMLLVYWCLYSNITYCNATRCVREQIWQPFYRHNCYIIVGAFYGFSLKKNVLSVMATFANCKTGCCRLQSVSTSL